MAMCAFSSSYTNASAISRIDPSYNTPNALGTISVYINKIGNVSYYVAKRYLGLVSNNVLQYTSPTALPLATKATFIDTSLNANTLYSYVFIATDVNGNSGSSTAAIPKGGNGDGSIYTLADPAGLILTYNGAGSSGFKASFTYAGTTTQTYSSVLIYDSANTQIVTPAPTYTTSEGTYTTSPIYDYNTTITYHAYVVNAAGLGNNIPVCLKNIVTCTWAYLYFYDVLQAGTLSNVDTLGTIWNSNNTTITNIATSSHTKFKYYKVSRTGNNETVLSLPQYSTTYQDLSKNLPANTQYTFKIIPYNSLDYPGNSMTTGAKYTLGDISALVVTIKSVSLDRISYNFSMTDATLFKSVVIANSINGYINPATYTFTTTPTFTATGSLPSQPVPYNTPVTLKFWAINGDDVGNNIDACYKTITNYTAGYGPNSQIKVAIPIALNSIRDINNNTITGFAPNGVGSYSSYIVTRTGGAGTVTSTVQTGTSYQDTSTDLLDNTAYKYTFQFINNDGYLYPVLASPGIAIAVSLYSTITATAITTSFTASVYTLANPNAPNTTISNKTWSLVTGTPNQKKYTFTCTGAFTGVKSNVVSKTGSTTIITYAAVNYGGSSPYTFGPNNMNQNNSQIVTANVTLYFYNGNYIGIPTGISVPESQLAFTDGPY